MSRLRDVAREINASFGAGSIMRLGDPGARVPMEAIPFGPVTLDLALGIGGVPRGRIIEVFGPESSGKTTLVLHLIRNAQMLGFGAAFIDAEHALDPFYAESIGVDVENLYLSQPDYGEQALDIANKVIETGEVGIVVVDSVAALTPLAELQGEMGDQMVGAQARMMGRAMRKLVAVTARTRTILVFTNQIREKTGVMFGSPETQPGGRALRFFASQRLDVRRIRAEGARGEQWGNSTRIRLVKNKVAPPFREAIVDIEFGRGMSVSGALVDKGVELGIVRKSGSFYVYEDVRAHGREAMKDALEDDVNVMRDVDRAVRESLGLPVVPQIWR